MSKLNASRNAQWPLVAEFTFNFDDTMKDVTGAEKDFGVSNIAATVFEVIPLPANAIVIGGEVVTEAAFDAATYTVTVGDAGDADRYLAATDAKGAGRIALTLSGYVTATGENVRISVDAADVCTTGKMTVRVMYVIRGRGNEVQVG